MSEQKPEMIEMPNIEYLSMQQIKKKWPDVPSKRSTPYVLWKAHLKEQKSEVLKLPASELKVKFEHLPDEEKDVSFFVLTIIGSLLRRCLSAYHTCAPKKKNSQRLSQTRRTHAFGLV